MTKIVFDDIQHDMTRALCEIHGVTYREGWKHLQLIIVPAVFFEAKLGALSLKEVVDCHNKVTNYFIKYPEKVPEFLEKGNYFEILKQAEKEGIWA